MLKAQLLKRFEEVKPRPGEAATLVDRMKNGAFSEADRQRVLEILEAEQEMLELLAACPLPSTSRKRARQGQSKRRRQLAKASRRRNRR